MRSRALGLLIAILFWCGICFWVPLSAQEPTRTTQTTQVEPAAVVLKGKRLFVFYSELNGNTPVERAQRTTEALRTLSEDTNFDVSSISLVETPSGTDIVSGATTIATVSSKDAEIAQSSTTRMANDFASKIRLAMVERIEKTTASAMVSAVALTVLLTVVLFFAIIFTSRVMTSLCKNLKEWQGTKIKSIKIQNAELIGANALADLLLSAVKFLQIALMLVFIAAYVLYSLSLFPQTRHTATAVIANVTAPLASFGEELVGYLPSIVMLTLIGLGTYAIISFARFFFDALRDGTITLADFDPDWSEPSYKLTRFVIISFALMIAMPYLPGWDSPAFKQVGLVLGILVSFGSTGVVSNVMAGAVLTYTNAFKIGDRIKIGDCTGDVVEKTLFVTRLQTPKNEVVSVPNGQIMTTNIINYSTLAKVGKLLVHTPITIGYDEPWKKVEAALIEAAKCTEGLQSEPEPFVLQTELGDYYVTYELNAYCSAANELPGVYSALHRNIQDKFNDAAMEIMSPAFMCIRDGNSIAIPREYVPKEYAPPSIRIATPKS